MTVSNVKGPEEQPRRAHDEPEGDVERPVEDDDPRESEETTDESITTDVTIATDDEFIDAGNEVQLEEDARIDSRA